jgi:hypothetical protein
LGYSLLRLQAARPGASRSEQLRQRGRSWGEGYEKRGAPWERPYQSPKTGRLSLLAAEFYAVTRAATIVELVGIVTEVLQALVDFLLLLVKMLLPGFQAPTLGIFGSFLDLFMMLMA